MRPNRLGIFAQPLLLFSGVLVDYQRVVHVLKLLDVGDDLVQEHLEAASILGFADMLELVDHSNEALNFEGRLLELTLGERPLFPVRQILGHIESLGKQDLVDHSEAPLALPLHLVVHDSDIDYAWHEPEEHEVVVEVLEVGYHGGHSKTSEYHRSLLENLAQLLIQHSTAIGIPTEPCKVNDVGLESGA